MCQNLLNSPSSCLDDSDLLILEKATSINPPPCSGGKNYSCKQKLSFCVVWGLPPVTPHSEGRWGLSWLEMTHVCTQYVRERVLVSLSGFQGQTLGFLWFVTLMSYSASSLSPPFLSLSPALFGFTDTASPLSLRASPVTLLVGWLLCRVCPDSGVCFEGGLRT